MRSLTIPQKFAEFTIAREGDAGRVWIERLPGVVEEYCQQWGLTVDGEPMHGGLSLVVPVRQGDEPCILKVGWVDSSTAQEALALAAWNGHGAVRLFAAQPEAGVMLLERLNSQHSLSDIGVKEAVVLAGRLLRRLAIPAPEGIASLKGTATWLSETFHDRWEQCGRPMARQQLDKACQLAKVLGPSAGDLLVNYDLFYADVLASEREPWLAVDPKVVAGDLEYGVAQLLWRRLEEMEAQGGLDTYFQSLTEAADLDPALARAWTFVRCVDYWLWGVSVGLTEDPARCKIITDWLE